MTVPARRPLDANQPRFISSAYLAGLAAQCVVSVCGCISEMLTIAPEASMNATESGISVFFIHMHSISASGNTNSMPSFGASDLRNMRPVARVSRVFATSARMRYMPATSCTTGIWASALEAAASAAAARTAGLFMGRYPGRETKKAGRSPCLSIRSLGELLLHFAFLLVVLLGRLLRRLLVRLLRILLHLAVLFHRLGAGVGRRENGAARNREHRRDQQGDQFAHVFLSVRLRFWNRPVPRTGLSH